MKSTNILNAVAVGACLAIGATTAVAKKPEKPVKMWAINDVQKTKPRKERGRPDEILVALTARGKELEARYSKALESLRAEIVGKLPVIDGAKKTACIEALRAVRTSEKNLAAKRHAHRAAIRNKENDLKRDTGKLAAIPGKVAAAELMLKRAMALPDGDEMKALAIESATKSLAKYKDSQETAEKLKKKISGLQSALTKNKPAEPAMLREIEVAEEALEQAKADAYRLVDALSIGGVLDSDGIDAKLAAYVVLAEATPTDLARYAQQGPEKENLINQLLNDTDLMVQMLVADSPVWEKFGPAMENYNAIRKASSRAGDALFQRLALAVSLEHAVPLNSIDPVKRYQSYEKAYLDGELDPGFKELSTWALRMVVNGDEPDAISAWGRKMLRNYRPDIVSLDDYAWRYVMSVNTEINYTSTFQKLGWDKPELHNYQNILANGGICGRRAFFGRFILRAFGIPTTARPQGGHAALVHWTPDGWVPCLGGGWGCSNRTIFRRYAKDLDFLASSQAREDTKAFMRVKRAQWVGDVLGEPRAYGYILQSPGFWYTVSLIEQNRIIDRLQARELAAVGEELGESDDSAEGDAVVHDIPVSERIVRVDSKYVITIPAAACSDPANSTDVILFMPSNLGGTQLHYTRYGTTDTFAYTVDAPKAGKYRLSARLVTPAPKQHLYLTVNDAEEIDIALPYTIGMWGELDSVEIELVQGRNELTFSRGHYFMRGVTIRDFKLTPAE